MSKGETPWQGTSVREGAEFHEAQDWTDNDSIEGRYGGLRSSQRPCDR